MLATLVTYTFILKIPYLSKLSICTTHKIK